MPCRIIFGYLTLRSHLLFLDACPKQHKSLILNASCLWTFCVFMMPLGLPSTRTHAHTHTHARARVVVQSEALWARIPEIQVRIPSRAMGTFFPHTVSSIFRLSLTHTHTLSLSLSMKNLECIVCSLWGEMHHHRATGCTQTSTKNPKIQRPCIYIQPETHVMRLWPVYTAWYDDKYYRKRGSASYIVREDWFVLCDL